MQPSMRDALLSVNKVWSIPYGSYHGSFMDRSTYYTVVYTVNGKEYVAYCMLIIEALILETKCLCTGKTYLVSEKLHGLFLMNSDIKTFLVVKMTVNTEHIISRAFIMRYII